MKNQRRKPSEAETLNAIIEYLRYRRIPHARVNNTGTLIYRDGKTIFGKRKHQQKGVADILACWKSWPLALEVKAEGKKQSPEQVDWESKWGGGGGIYAVVYNVEQVERILSAL